MRMRADLGVGCGGHHSITRAAAQLERSVFGVPIYVVWFRSSRCGSDPDQLLGNFNDGYAGSGHRGN